MCLTVILKVFLIFLILKRLKFLSVTNIRDTSYDHC